MNQTNVSFKEYYIESAEYAQKVLDFLVAQAEKYDKVSVGDYYDRLGQQVNYIDYAYGWSLESIKKARVEVIQDRHAMIKFEPLESMQDVKFKMDFSNYAPGALKQVVEQAPGKPFTNFEGEFLGTIKKAELRIENGLNLVEFTVEVN